MGFGNLGFGEMILILLVILLLFGAKRIPEIAGSMGKGIREFKRSMSDVEQAIRDPSAGGATDRLPPIPAPRAAQAPSHDDDSGREPKRLIG